MNTLILTAVLAVCMWTGALQARESEMPELGLMVHVVDENSKCIENAQVRVGFNPDNNFHGNTDDRGLFTSTARVAFPVCRILIDKVGYYRTRGTYILNSGGQTNRTKGRWLPYEYAVTTKLARIENPVPMFAKKAFFTLPCTNTTIGYDLVAGDLVTPYGAGTNTHFGFVLQRTEASVGPVEASVTVSTHNPGDGFVRVIGSRDHGSVLWMPRVAPSIGYLQSLRIETPDTNHVSSCSSIGYVFSVSEPKGGASGGMNHLFGKIVDGFAVVSKGSKTAKISFTYYLNPDGTRNLEFDPKRNLCPNLKSWEQVTEP
jgi:hypothetical protein